MISRKIVIILLVLAGMVSALSIEVGIEKSFSGEIKETSNISENNIIGYGIEFLNTGSLPYRAITRLDVFENGKIIGTSWSDYKILNPGDRTYMNVYSFAGKPGTFDARIRVYYANEIMEKWHRNITLGNVSYSDDINITKISYGSRFIDMELLSTSDIKNLVLTVDSQLPGWIFYQKSTSLKANTVGRERIYFEPDVAKDNYITIKAFGLDGKFAKTEAIEMKPKRDAIESLDNIISGFLSFLGSFAQL